MNWGIIVDSSSDLYANDISGENIGLEIVPLTINVGDKEYPDDANPKIDEMLAHMKKEKSGSSCPSPHDFKVAMEKYDNVICVVMTATLSGTYNSAMQAKEIVLEEHPNKNIHVINSNATAGSLVLTALKAKELIEMGKDFDFVAQECDRYCQDLFMVFCLGGYDNLIKAGRMSPFVGAVATHLGIKAICVRTKEGEISVKYKVRGQDRMFKTLIEHMKGCGRNLNDKPVCICQCKNEKGAETLKQMINEVWSSARVTILKSKALTSYYCMPGGLIAIY